MRLCFACGSVCEGRFDVGGAQEVRFAVQGEGVSLRCTRHLDGQVGMLTVHLHPLCLWSERFFGHDGR